LHLDTDTYGLTPSALESSIKNLKNANKIPKIIFLNYPNNPTGANTSPKNLEEIIKILRREEIMLLYDNPYGEIYDPGHPPPISIFNISGASEISIEFQSLSKSFMMTGWRLGFAAGKKEYIIPLRRLKSNFDSGIFTPLQLAGAYALKHMEICIPTRVEFQKRRKIVHDALDVMGLTYHKSFYTFYVWVKIPDDCLKKFSTIQFTDMALIKYGLVITPGTAFGQDGDGFFRISLCLKENKLADAMQVLEDVLKSCRN
jgi:LL-diaminopimelate aminotransferase